MWYSVPLLPMNLRTTGTGNTYAYIYFNTNNLLCNTSTCYVCSMYFSAVHLQKFHH